MNSLVKKAADLYRKANYCMARAEVYLSEAKNANEK